MAQFARDLYDLVNTELRADAIVQARMDAICSRIDEDVEDVAAANTGKDLLTSARRAI